jgi:hypothetical protein
MPRASFAAELYLPSAGPDCFPAIADRARAAADEMASEGYEIHYRGAVLLTEDETCFCFFEARSEDEIREASRRAAVPFDRIVPADGVPPVLSPARRAPQSPCHPRGEASR